MSSLRKCTLLIVLIKVITLVSARKPSRIVGGNLALPGELPFIVSLRYYDDHYCGGSIISPKHILTAGHCADDLSPKDIIVASGIRRQDDPRAVISKVEKITLHPEYIPKKGNQRLQNDVAVLTLKEELDLDGFLQDAAQLPNGPHVPGTVATAAGWGYTESLLEEGHGKEIPNYLRTLKLEIITHDECKKRRYPPFEYQICVTNKDATICQGDSGGPLAVDNVVIGIASTSSCLIGSASAYMDVYYFKEFIEDAMRS